MKKIKEIKKLKTQREDRENQGNQENQGIQENKKIEGEGIRLYTEGIRQGEGEGLSVYTVGEGDTKSMFELNFLISSNSSVIETDDNIS